MMGLFFLIVCAVGVLRPVKNSLALDGFAEGDFYKVYLVSAGVILFVPLYNRVANRVAWRWLIPGVALFFAFNLVLFRLLYVEGSATFGAVFYGWNDLFAAALVTQFFMMTQLFFDARMAKRAYPIVIAGGSLGATLGGAITAFFAESLGTPNLMLVAAAMIAVFSVVMPLVWTEEKPTPVAKTPGKSIEAEINTGQLRTIFANRHVRLIAITVLITILVKQLVDFQYNVLTKEVFVSRDAVTAFQGRFNAATQWMPLPVLALLWPAMRRWGVGVAVLLLPVAMFATGAAMVFAFGLAAAVAAKGAETALRYSAERAAREILYIPVPTELKLRAKAYIDVAVEKGIGKVLSAVLLATLLAFIPYRQTAYVTAGLAAVWVVLAIRLHREYIRTLARSIEGRFASLRGLAAVLTDASSLPVLRRALSSESPLQAAFTLDLLAQEPRSDVRPLAPELNALAAHPDAAIRAASLKQLARIADTADVAAVRARLLDEDQTVVEAALRVLLARPGTDEGELLRELLASPQTALRMAALRYLVHEGKLSTTRLVSREYLETHWASAHSDDANARTELALATAGLQHDPDADRFLTPFLDDTDPRVRGTALRSAALLGRVDLCDRLIAGLGDAATRQSAREALAILGEPAIEPLSRALLSETTPARTRRVLPSVLAGIPHQRTVAALLQLVLAPETDQLLDYRSVKALSKLRARQPELVFDPTLTWTLVQRELDAAVRYAAVLQSLPASEAEALNGLLRAALREAWRERRESVFRCIGMLHSPTDVYRSYVVTSNGHAQQRANSLEWLEHALGHTQYERLAPIVEAAAPEQVSTHGALPDLTDDGDTWIATLWRAQRATPSPIHGGIMELVEKVLLLQRVDLLRGARGSHLALLAGIADVIAVEPGEILLSPGEPLTAMYVVTRGSVKLHGVGEHITVSTGDAFGTWALIDESPGLLEARTVEHTELLRISRTDFHDLVADHPELSLALLQGLARRMRSLVA